MQSLNSMKTKLAPLGLYRLEGGTAVSAELSAYAAGLDVLYAALEEMEREAFPQTAETYGLSERERFTGAEQSALPLEKRRRILVGAEQMLGLSATPDDYIKYVKALGYEQVDIVEKPKQSWLQVFISDSLTPVQIQDAADKVLNASPPQIHVTVNFWDGTEIDN